MLNITVKTSDPDLTTTGALKARLFGTTSTSTANDASLSALIRAASRWAESFIGYPLTLQSYEETVPTYGTRRLMLSRTPIRALRLFESTEDDAFEVTSTQFRMEDPEAGILTRDEGWPWTVPTELELEERPLPGEESAPWYATYQAGYTYNGLSTASTNWSTHAGSTDTGRTLPEDIEEGVLMKARSLYEQSVGGGEVESEQLGDLTVRYRSGGDAKGGAAAAEGFGAPELLLARFRRIV
jgi:hypothetical protein